MVPVCRNGQQAAIIFTSTTESGQHLERLPQEVKSSEQWKGTAASFNACSMDAIKTFQDLATEFWQRTSLLNTFIMVCTLSQKATFKLQRRKKFAGFKCYECFVGWFFFSFFNITFPPAYASYLNIIPNYQWLFYTAGN